MTPGRKALKTISIYRKRGLARLPAGFLKRGERVEVTTEGKRTLVFRATRSRTRGLSPYWAAQAQCPQVNVHRLIRQLGFEADAVAGEYAVTSANGRLRIELRAG